jgi:hypothetical protein
VYTAILSCGTVLTYESRTYVPERGERVPCRRHGYCGVTHCGVMGPTRSRRPRSGRPKPKAQDELMVWLRARSVTTVHALRRQRFTLRMVAAAEREGLVTVDFEAGTVAIR